jgi:hypothetical protein
LRVVSKHRLRAGASGSASLPGLVQTRAAERPQGLLTADIGRGGPERRTQVVERASGDEASNASWADARRRHDVAYGIRRADDLAAVGAFLEARNDLAGQGDGLECAP